MVRPGLEPIGRGGRGAGCDWFRAEVKKKKVVKSKEAEMDDNFNTKRKLYIHNLQYVNVIDSMSCSA